MANPENPRVRELLMKVMEQSPDLRPSFLEQACGGDDSLRAQVQSHLIDMEKGGEPFGREVVYPDAAGRTKGADAGWAEKPGTRIGRYELLQRLGEGGFGSVFMAEQHHPIRRTVALKIIKMGMDTKQVVARFDVERQALAMMDHPCIAKVLDAGATDTGRPYFVMELVKGLPITRFCDSNNLTTDERLRLFIQVCEGVQHAHQKGIIHRDLKPGNVLVSVVDDKPLPKIIDFGIAKATHAPLTERTCFTEYRHLIGTPEYISPEQAEMSGIDIDTRSDVYSLGVLLYELLTGTTPFDGGELRKLAFDQIQKMIREVQPLRPSTRLSSLGDTLASIAAHRRTEPSRLLYSMRGELDWIVMKCLEKDRTQRYDSATALAMDLQRYLSHQPVLARPASVRYRLRKFVQRHTLEVGLVAGLAVVFLTLLIGLVFQTKRLSHALDTAVDLKSEAQHQAVEARKNARQARENLAVGLIHAGDSLAKSDRVAEARANYLRAWDICRELGLPEIRALSAVVPSADTFAIPLMGSYGDNIGAGGFEGHENTITCALLRNGRTAITSGEDGTIRVWDLPTGAELRPPLSGHNAGVSLMALSPDEQFLFSASHKGELWRWDLRDTMEKWTHEALPGADGADGADIWAVAVSGEVVLAGSTDGRIRKWDLRTSSALPAFNPPAAEGDWAVGYIAIAPDGKTALSGHRGGQIRRWNVADGTEMPQSFAGNNGQAAHFRQVNALLYQADGRTAISSGFDGAIKRWNVETGTEILPRFEKRHTGIWRIALSPNQKSLISGGRDFSVCLWDVDTGKLRHRLFTYGDCMGVAFSPDGKTAIASDRKASSLRVWDLTSDEHVGQPTGASAITSVAVNNEGLILYGRSDGQVALWDGKTNRAVLALGAHRGAVQCVTFSPNGEMALSAGDDGRVMLWNLESAAQAQEFAGHNGGASCAALTGDGLTAISGGADKVVRVWNCRTGEQLRELRGHAGPVTAVCLSRDGTWLLSAGKDGELRLWNWQSGKEAHLARSAGGKALLNGVISANGRSAVGLDSDGEVLAWEFGQNRATQAPRKFGARERALVLSREDTIAWTVGADGGLTAWDILAGERIRSLPGHAAAASCIAISPNGACIVTGGAVVFAGPSGTVQEGRLKLWDLSWPAECRYLESAARQLRARLYQTNVYRDPSALAIFGEWHAFRGRDDWARDCLERARLGGAVTSSLTLGRCYWRLSETDASLRARAHREFTRAIEHNEAPAYYLRLCLRALAD